jgi:hypothetical protein
MIDHLTIRQAKAVAAACKLAPPGTGEAVEAAIAAALGGKPPYSDNQLNDAIWRVCAENGIDLPILR